MEKLTTLRLFDLYGTQIGVRCRVPDLFDEIVPLFVRTGAEEVGRVEEASEGLTMSFAKGERYQIPIEAKKVQEDVDLFPALWKVSDGYLLEREDATVRIHPKKGTARTRIHEDRYPLSDRHRLVLMYLTMSALALLLRYRGWFAIHGAGVARGQEGLLLIAPSDSGKSTIAFNLLRQGWSYISDDSLLLHRTDEGSVEAFAFRKPLCIDAGPASAFPELRDRNWPSMLSDEDKWRIPLEELYPERLAEKCIPRVLVAPAITQAPTSTLTALEPKAMMTHLLTQSALFLTPDRVVATQHLDLLKQLVTQASSYRLDVGSDLLERPSKIDRMLGPLLQHGTP